MKLNKKSLQEMLVQLQTAPLIYQPSEHWQRLNRIHIKQLHEDITTFKRSVNMHYFNWGPLGILAHQAQIIFDEFVLKRNFIPALKSYFGNLGAQSRRNHATTFNFIGALVYKIYTVSLYEYVQHKDQLKILENINEPFLGDPFVVRYKNGVVSQDLCNSVHEFYSATKKLDLNQPLHIADIGAGYGRLAYVFLKTLPKATYTIIDLPPALYLSQEYLSNIFPQEKVFHFRPFRSFAEAKDEFLSSRIRFIMSYQIEQLPDELFDLVVNVSTLHEMTRPQIANYLAQINRLSRGYCYIKQWRKSRYNDSLFIREDEYPIPRNWRVIYHRRHPIQRMFFDALYQVRRG